MNLYELHRVDPATGQAHTIGTCAATTLAKAERKLSRAYLPIANQQDKLVVKFVGPAPRKEKTYD